MKRHLCNSAGCFVLLDDANKFCLAHQTQQRAKDARIRASMEGRWMRGGSAAYRPIYNNPKWRKARAKQLELFPYCMVCGAPATSVDHIIPHKGREEFAFNPDNLQSLCFGCHMVKTRQDKGKK